MTCSSEPNSYMSLSVSPSALGRTDRWLYHNIHEPAACSNLQPITQQRPKPSLSAALCAHRPTWEDTEEEADSTSLRCNHSSTAFPKKDINAYFAWTTNGLLYQTMTLSKHISALHSVHTTSHFSCVIIKQMFLYKNILVHCTRDSLWVWEEP